MGGKSYIKKSAGIAKGKKKVNAAAGIKSSRSSIRKAVGRPVLSGRLREKLEHHKYGRWAIDLTEENLLALLVMVGEFSARSHSVMGILMDHPIAEIDLLLGFVRVRAALEVIRDLRNDRGIDMKEASRRFHEAVRKSESELSACCACCCDDDKQGKQRKAKMKPGRPTH